MNRSDSPYRPPSRRRRKIIGVFYDDYESYDSDDSQHLAEWTEAPPQIPASFYECAPLPYFCKGKTECRDLQSKSGSNKFDKNPIETIAGPIPNIKDIKESVVPVQFISSETQTVDQKITNEKEHVNECYSSSLKISETLPSSDSNISIPENVDSESESFEFVTTLLVESEPSKPESENVESEKEITQPEKNNLLVADDVSDPVADSDVVATPAAISRPRLSLASLEKLNQITQKNPIQFSELETRKNRISAISTFDAGSRSAATQNSLQKWKSIHKK